MDITLAPTPTANLLQHGRLACRRCFSSDGNTQTIGKWQMVNDPAAWGSANPTILILGFSKGFTQANAFRTGRFEDIPFKDMRTRLTEEMRMLGVIGKSEIIDQRMVATETEIGFGSLVRCSLSRVNKKGVLACTGEVMPKALTEEISANLKTCAKTFVGDLPSSVRLVLMLGTTDSYIDGCREVVRSLHGPRFSEINDVSYRTGHVVWVHISHPSGLNGNHPAWMAGDASTTSGLKQHLAIKAIAMSGAVRLQHFDRFKSSEAL
ncbi:hypothetical protein [Bradyrhizobium sp. AZCC 2289]|uniref:hypothetical protein n=1 Tax=Bradyrhizobium sp. AZCC 2289 TaxID=3117026 RepID=UPI002FEFCCEF